MKKRLFTVLLCALLLALASCSKEPVESAAEPVSEPTAAEETVPEKTEPQFVPDELPDTLKYDGRNAYITLGDYSSAYSGDMYSESLIGERYNDAIYSMLQTVQERLDVKLDYLIEPYTWDGMTAFQTSVTANIMAQSDTFDLLFDVANYSSQMLSGDYFINLAETAYIDLDKPWYNQTVMENMPSGYIWFLSGQFSIANVKNSFGIYFNDDLYQALGKTENLYELVDSGKWTLDKMESILEGTYADLDGSGTATAEDQYGLTFGDWNKYLGFIPSNHVKVFSKHADGYTFEYDSERAVETIQRLCMLVHENENVLPALGNSENPEWLTSMGGGNYASNVFLRGNAIFQAGLLADSTVLVGEIPFAYGLLPYPKYDEAQINYQTMLQRNCYALIPLSAPDTDFSSAVLEAIASETYRSLIPEYFEVSLKSRYAADNNMARMFDLIAQGVTYDPGEIFSGQLGTPTAKFRENIMNNNPNWASTTVALKKSLVKAMDEVYEQMKDK